MIRIEWCIYFSSVMAGCLLVTMIVPVSAIQFSDVQGRGVWCNGHGCGYPSGTEHNESMAWDGDIKTGNIVYQYTQGWQPQYDLFIFPSDTTLSSCEIFSGDSVEFGGSCFSGPHNYAFINSSYMIWSAPVDKWSTITFNPPVRVGSSFSISTPTGGQCWRINETRCYGWNTTYSDNTTADFIANPVSGPAPLTIRFNDTSTHAPTSWAWDFGDGGISTDQNPSHTYATAGTYDVGLTATNVMGSNRTLKTGYVTVTSPEPVVYTYSVTNTDGAVNETTGKWIWNDNARGDIENMITYFDTDSNWNDNVRWKLKFIKEWPDVTKGNFGVNPADGENSLNQATLHYHTGHGYASTDGHNSFLHLLAQEPSLPNIDLKPSEVEGKWGGNNKWVILSSCLVLRDNEWGNAFAPSHGTHGIMGYKTDSTPRKHFMEIFFRYAKTNSVRDSFLLTVKQLDPSSVVDAPNGRKERVTAVTVFSNNTLAENDYLPGYGKGIQSDTLVNPSWSQWPPKIEGGV